MRTSSSTQYSLWYHCPFSHHLFTDYGGGGIVNIEENIHTTFGSACHDALEGLCLGEEMWQAFGKIAAGCGDFKGVTADGYPRAKELAWLGCSLCLVFEKYYLKPFQEQYDIRGIEQEFVVPFSPEFSWLCRPDLLLERKTDKHLFNGNIKTSGYIKDLKEVYEFSIQMLLEALAVQLHNGETTGGTVIIALSKGQKGKLNKRDIEKGKTGLRQDSPLTYVWWKNGTYTFQWAVKAEKIGVWEFNQSPNEWIDKLPVDVARAQIDISDPITHGKGLSIQTVMKDILTVNKLAIKGCHPHNYDACNSYGTFRRPCAYKLWCHGTEQERADNFIPRTPHHPHEEAMKSLNKEDL